MNSVIGNIVRGADRYVTDELIPALSTVLVAGWFGVMVLAVVLWASTYLR